MTDLNTATRLISVIDGAIEKGTKSGANIEVTYGQVFGLTGGMEASVYLAGSRELAESDGGDAQPSEGFRVPAHLTVFASDYVRVAIDQRGHRWIEEVIPTTAYPTVSIDVVRGEILKGDGTVAPTPWGGDGGGGGSPTAYYKPVGANNPAAVTTNGQPQWVPLATADGDIVMVEILL